MIHVDGKDVINWRKLCNHIDSGNSPQSFEQPKTDNFDGTNTGEDFTKVLHVVNNYQRMAIVPPLVRDYTVLNSRNATTSVSIVCMILDIFIFFS